jgi:hypothetical protein
MRPWDRSTSLSIEKSIGTKFHLQANYVEPVVFTIFMVLSMFFALAIFGFKNNFRQSDVDVLFPTPISSKVVMFFRLFREYSLTLLFPLLLGLFSFQFGIGAFNAIKRNDPQILNSMIKGGLVAWILMALAWISISYALSFYVAKHEKKTRLITNSVGWLIFAVIALVIGSIWVRMRISPSFETFSMATSEPWLRVLMFMPTAGSEIAMGAFHASRLHSVLGVGAFLVIIVACLTYSANLSDWMYDQAATKGFQGQAMKDFARKGDMMAVAAERARTGKFGKSRIAKKAANWNFRKGWTLIYKEILIQSRIGFWMNLIFVVSIGGLGIMFLFLPEVGGNFNPGPYIYLGLTGFMAVNMSSIQAFSGFVETLRRVEVMKPLPFTSAQIAFYETAAKSVIAMFMAVAPFLIGFAYKPALWQIHLAGIITAPTLALALVSAIFLVVVLFPDFDDPTQRSFRGIMQMIAMIVIMAPTALTFIGLIILGVSPLIPAVICCILNFGMTALFTSIAGRFYADFNPTE